MLSKTHLLISVLSISIIFSSVHAQGDEQATFASTKITDQLYMLSSKTGFVGGNIGVSIGNDGVVIIDNGMPTVLEKLRVEIGKLTDQPIDYLINTHIHGDHIGNNAAFGADGARIISHDNLRAALLKNGVGNTDKFVAAPEPALPVITFSDKMTLNLNGDALKIIHLKSAHTNGDSIIFFQNANVLHTGDILFNQRFPYIDYSNGGSLDGVIAALTEILTYGDENTKIIPGHGPMASKQDIKTTIAMLEDTKQLVALLITEGKSDEEIITANPLEKYEDYSWSFITTERMTQQIITALRNNN